MMKKRGVGDQVMVYALVVLVLGAIAIVGWKMVHSTTSRFCKTELADFRLLLTESASSLRNGEVDEKHMDVPCAAQKVYLFDSAKKPSGGMFTSNPRLRDAVGSNAAKNVYIMEKGGVVDSFEVPNLEIPYPYFTCMVPSSGKISFSLSGIGRGMVVEPSCLLRNCVVVPEQYEVGRVNEVFQQANNAGLNLHIDDVRQSATSLYNLIEVEREYRQCNGKLHMELRFTAKQSGAPIPPFTYLETIPACISSPSEAYANLQGFSNPDSPILRFNSPSESASPVMISYEVRESLDDGCLEQIKGVAYT